MRQHFLHENTIFSVISVKIAILLSIAFFPCFSVQAQEDLQHVHYYETTIIINPTETEKGLMSMYCPECGDFGYYAIDPGESGTSLHDSDYTQIYSNILKMLSTCLSSSPMPSSISPYLTSEQKISYAAIGLIVLFIVFLLIRQSNREG